MSRLVDITFEAIGELADGRQVCGVVTARADLGLVAWPDQQWEGRTRGINPLPIVEGGAPMHIHTITQVQVVDEAHA